MQKRKICKKRGGLEGNPLPKSSAGDPPSISSSCFAMQKAEKGGQGQPRRDPPSLACLLERFPWMGMRGGLRAPLVAKAPGEAEEGGRKEGGCFFQRAGLPGGRVAGAGLGSAWPAALGGSSPAEEGLGFVRGPGSLFLPSLPPREAGLAGWLAGEGPGEA